MLRTYNFCRSFAIWIGLILLFAPLAFGQITNAGDDQSAPIPGAGHDYIKMVNETVNPANGSVSLRIQVPVPPGRKLTVPFAFAYDSSGVDHVMSGAGGSGVYTSNQSVLSQGGWQYTVPLISSIYNTLTQSHQGSGPYTCNFLTNYMFEDPSGGRHQLGLSYINLNSVVTDHDCQYVNPSPSAYYSSYIYSDDVYQASMTGYSPIIVTDPDGTVYSFSDPGYTTAGAIVGGGALPTGIEDRNGNQVTVTGSVNTGFSFTDTLGRPSVSVSGFGSSGGDTVAVAGFGSYTVYWGTANVNMPRPNVHNVGTESHCTAISSYVTSHPVVRSIVLPNGQSYQFAYDSDNPSLYDLPGQGPFGLVSKITYPTGGYVRYVWGVNSLAEFGSFPNSLQTANACQYQYDSMAVAQRYVSDGKTEVLEQTFSYQTNWNETGNAWTSKQTTVNSSGTGVSAITIYQYIGGNFNSPPNVNTSFAASVPLEQTIEYEDGSGNLLRTVNKSWFMPDEMACQSTTQGGLTSRVDYTYGPGAQITHKKEWDWGQQAPCPTPYTAPTGTPLRETVTVPNSFATPVGGTILDRPASVTICSLTGTGPTYSSCAGGVQAAQTIYTYATSEGQVSATKHDDTNYGYNSNAPRGNVTSRSEWVNTTGSLLTWNYSYDDTGQMSSMTDPKNNQTLYYYNDEYSSNGTCGSRPGNTNAYLTKIQDAKGFTQTFTYRYCDGELKSSTDKNGQPTSYLYGADDPTNADTLDRLTEISYPDGGLTKYSYTSICGQPSSTSILLSSPSTYYNESATMDGLCHVQVKTITDPQGNDLTATTYDGLGRVLTVSNPYRSTGDTSYGVTTYDYDALGRAANIASPCSVTAKTCAINYPDGSSTQMTYSGNTTTIIDPAGSTRTLEYDGLGRLEQVTENGINSTTTYAHDALDDLNGVSQGGVQSRTFGYDSLARLTSATNPESGTTDYYYTVSGGALCSGDPSAVCSRTDNRGITTTYTYNDPLNRLTSKTYSDGTPAATFSYDEASVPLGSWTSPTLGYPNGRLTHTTTVSGSALLTATVQDYDKMGRTADYWQCTPVNCGTSSPWATNYNYDLAGDVTQWNHPAGFTISQPVDAARHVMQVTSTVSGSTYPATLAFGAGTNSSIEYTPWGAVSQLENGCVGSGCANIQETYFYNNRMQMAVAELGIVGSNQKDSCREYSYYANTVPTGCSESSSAWPTGTTNNGNVGGYLYNDNAIAGLSHPAGYTYDGVNRLTKVVVLGSPAYTQNFTYDIFGNLSCAPSGPGCVAFSYNPNTTTNQVTNAGYSYDLAGDLQTDGMYTYQWDAEAHLAAVYQSGNVVSLNTYNALGQRVEDVTPTSTTDEAYGAGGNLLLRYTGDSNSRSFVPFNGGILAEYYCGGMIFDHPDEIGSLTTATDCAGNVVRERLYYPFGEFWTGAGSSGMHQEFAQLPDYDPETDQYNTLARHYSPSGRWLSPDRAFADQHAANPQSWNLYSYVRNNPMMSIDTDGRSTISFDGRAHTITVFSWDGSKIVVRTFHAANNVAVHNPENHPSGFANGPMTNGAHAVRKRDQGGAITHLHLASDSAYGSHGMIHLEDFTGVTGKTVTGAGLHSGGKGPESLTYGCIRTTDEAMAYVNAVAQWDPLTEIDVWNNGENIQDWADKAEAAGASVDDDMVQRQQDAATSNPSQQWGGHPANQRDQDQPIQEDMQRQCALGNRAACN